MQVNFIPPSNQAATKLLHVDYMDMDQQCGGVSLSTTSRPKGETAKQSAVDFAGHLQSFINAHTGSKPNHILNRVPRLLIRNRLPKHRSLETIYQDPQRT